LSRNTKHTGKSKKETKCSGGTIKCQWNFSYISYSAYIPKQKMQLLQFVNDKCTPSKSVELKDYLDATRTQQ